MGTGAYDLSGAMWEWFTPDTMLPSQWGDRHRTAQESWMKPLYAAYFEQWLNDYQKPPKGCKKPQQVADYRVKQREWVDVRADGPFTFVAVCDVFGKDHVAMREHLIQWMDRVDGGEHMKIARRSPVVDQNYKISPLGRVMK